jgi:hypothetical protein
MGTRSWSHWLYWQRGGHCVAVRGARKLSFIARREDSHRWCRSMNGRLLQKEEKTLVATHVTSRNVPTVTASMISEPKLWSFGWRRNCRRFAISQKLATPRNFMQFAPLRTLRKWMRQPASGKAHLEASCRRG